MRQIARSPRPTPAAALLLALILAVPFVPVALAELLWRLCAGAAG